MIRDFSLNNSFLEKHFLIVSISIISIFELLLGLQGIDLRDSGFVLTACKEIFHTPESNQYYFLYYLNAVIGGVWHFITNGGSYFWFKVLNLIIIVSTYYFVQRIFKLFNANKLWVFLGYFVVIMQQNREYSGLFVFHHNFTSALFTTAAVCMLLEGLINTCYKKIYLSGLILGLGTFLRLPNAVLTIMAAAVVLCNYFYDKNLKLFFKRGIFCFLGYATGFMLVIGFMAICKNHLEIFKRAVFGDMTASARNTASSHNPTNLASMYVENIKQVAIVGFSVFAFYWLYNKFVINKYKFLFFLSLPILFVFVYGFYRFVFPASIVYGIFYAIIFYNVIKNHKNKNLMLLIVASVFVSVLQPVGSDYGIGNMGSCSIQLIVPLSFYLVNDLNIDKILDNNDVKNRWKIVCFTLIIFFIFIQIKTIFNYGTFGYPDKRAKMFSTIKSTPLAGCFVSAQQSQSLDSLLVNAQKYIQPNDYAICYPFLSGLYYLTQSKPYGYNSIGGGNLYRANVENLPLPSAIIRPENLPESYVDKFIIDNNYILVYKKYGYEIFANSN